MGAELGAGRGEIRDVSQGKEASSSRGTGGSVTRADPNKPGGVPRQAGIIA